MSRLYEFWGGMPEFNQPKWEPYKKIDVDTGDGVLYLRLDNESDYQELLSKGLKVTGNKATTKGRQELSTITNQKITDKTKSLWYPFKSHWGGITHQWTTNNPMKPRYPFYVVSKNRWDKCITSRELNIRGINHYVLVEEDQFELYMANKQPLAELLVLPKKYLDEYDTCDDLGDTKGKGPGAARNFCIDHSKTNGYDKHWVLDDNMEIFKRLHNNEKLEIVCVNGFCAVEDFIDRFSNVPIAGLNYESFCKKTDKANPYILNTRVYSCLLMDNTFDYRWRGRYNEDTDICLRVLKDGLCTIQVNAFLAGKVTTQRMRGGNSEEFYDKEGTMPKSKMLEDLHPDVAKVVWKFNRWHHSVDYKPFKKNKLLLKDGVTIQTTPNNYGLIKEEITNE